MSNLCADGRVGNLLPSGSGPSGPRAPIIPILRAETVSGADVAGSRVASTAESLVRIAEAITQAPMVALDTETTGLDPILDQPRLLQLALPDQIFVIDLFKSGGLGPIAAVLRKTRWLGHNLTFDAAFLSHHFGVSPPAVLDTMIASKLLAKGEGLKSKGTHSLQALLIRELGIELPKEMQASNWEGAFLPSRSLTLPATFATYSRLTKFWSENSHGSLCATQRPSNFPLFLRWSR
ncbi:MAG: hypothetical protein GY811_19880 [Myxococcales bacterium]|nr:hypothetical protein [Myxococcales bacterium]